VNSSAGHFRWNSARTRFHRISSTRACRIPGAPHLDLTGVAERLRRPATLGDIEPGLKLNVLGHTINFSVPMVTYINVKPPCVSGVNQNTDATVPGFMFSVSYPLRFGGRSRTSE